MIEIKLLSFGYDKRLVLKDISCTIKPNEFIAIIGPNGGGKTTFLKLLAGLIDPVAGSITIAGKTPTKLAGQIGYVPQITNFDKEFPISTLDVVLGGAIHELPWYGQFSKAQKEKAHAILKKLDLDHLCQLPFGDLSGGQAQRVLIARALMNDPKILFLDEPTANVDKEAKQKIHELLKELKHKVTIFVVTHETPGVIPFCDRVFCIQKTLLEMDKNTVCSHFAFGVYHELN